jgi:uncharacterized protein YbjT (DUF2867 family)
MRIAIIGGTGNAGRALCAQAVSRGHQVTAMVRNRVAISTSRTPRPAQPGVGRRFQVKPALPTSRSPTPSCTG